LLTATYSQAKTAIEDFFGGSGTLNDPFTDLLAEGDLLRGRTNFVVFSFAYIQGVGSDPDSISLRLVQNVNGTRSGVGAAGPVGSGP